MLMANDPEIDLAFISLQPFLYQLHAIVCAAVIHQDTLQIILPGLYHHTMQTILDIRSHIVYWNNN
jgi:hypothetical protein